jgi:hypothetical protein
MFLFDIHYTTRTYFFLENIISDFLADVPLIIRRELHFLLHGTPAHFSLIARRCPNRKFPDGWTNCLASAIT